MTKRFLHRIELHKYASKVGTLKKGTFEKRPDVDLKETGFYMVVDDSTGRVVFRFFVAPTQKAKYSATRMLRRIKSGEYETSAMVGLLDSASLYLVPHDKIKNLFGLPNMNGSVTESAIQLRFGDGENYSQWNRMLFELYEFEFQPY